MARESLHQLTHRLRQDDRRITGPRQDILDALSTNEHPRTIREIHAALPSPCDLATVYRAMHLLEELKLVKRFDFGDGTARYELICGDNNAHHHHLICHKCDRIVEIDECFSSELERKIARRNGFTALTHKLEFFGLCPECQ